MKFRIKLCFLTCMAFGKVFSEETAEDFILTTQFTKENLDGSLDGYDRVTVNTPTGTIHGRSKENDGEKTVSFLGIPYAKPPVGKLRLRAPQPVESYEDFEAFKFGEACVQQPGIMGDPNEFKGSEDCLTLNIFKNTDDFSEKQPVMVWIHGGAYMVGSARTYNPVFLIQKDVTVVTIHYRLTSLGFLSFGNEVAPGNLGMRDQIEALRWVQKHISSFGGDPDKVTIFGESAGGMSTHSLQLSPAAAGLFSAAIHQSGTLLMRRDFVESTKQQVKVAEELAHTFKSPSKALDQDTLDHFQSIPVKEFINMTKDLKYQGFWTPMQDGFLNDPVLPMNTHQAMLHGYFNKVPIMTGSIKNDGGLLFPPMDMELLIKWLGPFYLGTSNHLFTSEISEESVLAAQIIYKYYNGDNFDMLEVLPSYVDMLTDAIFLSPDQKVAEYASKYAPVYNYRFNYAGNHTFLPLFTAKSPIKDEKEALDKLKPIHGDELLYLFDLQPLTLEKDIEMRDLMVKYWTNFAKYGNPSPPQDSSVTKWTTYSIDKNCMQLDAEPKMEQKVEEKRMLFWQLIHWNQRESERMIMSSNIKTKFNYFNGLTTKCSEHNKKP